ncbi:MAG: glycoside hydrolase family protein [Brevundimonas sp.]|uniref:lysozyme n=1 Tax=Brevundimonas sp. TaxID=1871086 RepID=UPI002717C2C4|nr:glycoside hydrolase family protein [Brevundimonas sp.]MDO9588729.1 glycoside hydrolase family protein [Brevundimonas sp.]MDP3656927.1 glycoside hydrolase family protein [Brevundimonas sp.]MDZ4113217.1 glycoside hydrolase family protein [Brevundimonas sp.]
MLIKSFEGFRPRAAQGEDGRWVIGYGHTASAREGLTVGEQDAELLLQYDLLPVVKALNDGVSTPLNQHQFDALASFAISVGVDQFLASDVLQRLNEGHAGQAADALIGWPEAATPDDRLRRRAAERALFVADPAVAVTLADLLAAPLPPPLVGTPAEAVVRTDADASAVAIAAPPAETDPAVAPAAEPPVREPGWAPEEPAFEPPAVKAVDVVTKVNLDRYSPYAAAIIGPLPGFGPATEVASMPAAGPVAPGLTSEPAPDSRPEAGSEPAPVVPVFPARPIASPFPPTDPALVLTPATEADFVASERPVWPAEQRNETPPATETVLFEDEPTLSVLRHEVEPAGPRRFDWSETGAYLIMGGVGLVACAASAASFRKALTDDSFIGDYTVIGWVLALIGVVCVGLSSWKLYVRWGKPD